MRRESQLIEEDDKGQEDDDEGGEGEEGEEGGEGEGGGEESDIKSNNPHLTGGEYISNPSPEHNTDAQCFVSIINVRFGWSQCERPDHS